MSVKHSVAVGGTGVGASFAVRFAHVRLKPDRLEDSNMKSTLPWILMTALAAQADDTLVVTPGRTAESSTTALADVQVITQAQTAAAPELDLGGLLQNYAGLDVVRSGGPGQQTSVFMRGANSDQTLVMIDGVPVNNGSADLASLAYLVDPLNIDHIEIVRGPLSSLWGANAIGGVINIITHKASGTSTDVLFQGGPEQTRQSEVRQDVQLGHFTGSLSAGNNNTAGYALLTPSSATNPNVDSGNFMHHGAASMVWSADQWKLQSSFAQQDGRNQYINSNSPVEQNALARQGRVQLNVQASSLWQTQLIVARNIDHQDQRYSSDYAHTDQNEVDWQNTLQLSPNQQVIAGGTSTHQRVAASIYGSVYDVMLNDAAAYAEDRWHHGAFSSELAGRYDGSNTYGHHLTGSATLGYALDADHHLYASHATAFKTPSGNDLYGYGGNPALQPETSTNEEIGSKNHYGDWEVDAAIYRDRVHDLINYVLIDPANYFYQTQNVDRALLRGVETQVDWKQGPWSVHSRLDLERASDLVAYTDLPRRPRARWNSNLAYDGQRWGVQGSLLSANDAPNSAYDTITLPGYAIVNVEAHWQVCPGFRLLASVDNLGNKFQIVAANSTSSYYRGQPRLVQVGFDAHF